MKNFLKKYGNYILVFMVPWLFILVHAFVRDSWPIGGGSLLAGDTGQQLYPLMVELWNKVHSGESLFYSWNAMNGYDFYLNMTYYLISPFNLLIFLFPKSMLEWGVQFIMVFKWSLMGVTMTYYFMHTRHNQLKECKTLISSVLGLAFVLSNVMLRFLGYFNWSDVILLFPLLLLLVEKMVEKGNWKKYYLLLTLAMLCNFYMAYQVCIFLCIWFVLHLNKNTTHKKKKLLTFVGSSILSALTSAVTILPGVLGVGQRYSDGTSLDKLSVNLKMWVADIWDFGEKLFIFNGDLLDWSTYQPNIYFSVGLFVCCILFFAVKIKKSEKIKYGLVWGFFIFSICSGVMLYIWHGFALPNGVFHRYMYMFLFIMLFMAFCAIQNLETINWIGILVCGVGELVFLVVTFLRQEILNDFYGYLVTFLLLVLYYIILILYLRRSITLKQLMVTVMVLVTLELSVNAVYQLKEYNIVTWENSMENDSGNRLSENISLEKGEKVSYEQCATNMGLVESVPGTNGFLSYVNGDMVRLYERLGLEFSNDASGRIEGGSPLINLMFNIRYGIGNWEGYFSDCEVVATDGSMHLYEMNRLAGLGYMVSEDVVQWDVNKGANFDLQNSFIEKTTKEDGIFEVVIPEVNFTDGALAYKPDEEVLDNGYFLYEYTSKNVAATEMTEFSFTVSEDMDLYLDMFSQKAMWSIIYIDGKQVCMDENLRYQGYYHLGEVKKGQEVYIYSMHSMDVGESATIWYRLAKFNEENYAKAYDKLSKNVYEVEEMTSDYVSGSIHADEDGVMLTSIPAMKGFHVYVDGKEQEYEAIGDALIGVQLTKGDHKVEFRYQTLYFELGLTITMMGLGIFVGICTWDRKKRRMK